MCLLIVFFYKQQPEQSNKIQIMNNNNNKKETADVWLFFPLSSSFQIHRLIAPIGNAILVTIIIIIIIIMMMMMMMMKWMKSQRIFFFILFIPLNNTGKHYTFLFCFVLFFVFHPPPFLSVYLSTHLWLTTVAACLLGYPEKKGVVCRFRFRFFFFEGGINNNLLLLCVNHN